jgi:hypothetical protein
VRIAVSGTHCSGKTTLIDDFIAAHPDYVREPEPYEWLEDGEPFSDEPTVDDFRRQLEVSVERLRNYAPGTQVIAERSPIDFLAYILAQNDLKREGRDCELITSAAELAAEGMRHLDLLVILPLNDRDGIAVPESEDPELREAMNDRLLDLINDDEYALFASGSPRVIEVQGTRSQRLQLLEQAIPGASRRVLTRP